MARQPGPQFWLLAIGLAPLLGACPEAASPAEGPARVAFVHDALCRDLAPMLARDPDAVADKLALMASEPFVYFRGSLALWHLDTRAPDGVGFLASAVNVPEADQLMLVGDPHPENAGTFRVPAAGQLQCESGDGGAMTIEWNDFDAATWGPWLHDVRRLATGVELVLGDAVLAPKDRATAVEAVVRGYIEGLAAPAELGPLPRVASELVARAEAAGDARAQLADLAPEHGDQDTSVDFVHDDRFVPLTGDETVLVQSLLVAWGPSVAAQVGAEVPEALAKRLAAAAPEAMARRLGVGIASFPLRRFDVWFATPKVEGDAAAAGDADGGDPAKPEDGLMFEFKEVAPAPSWDLPAGYAAAKTGLFPNEAARSVAAEHALQRVPQGDAWLSWVTSGGAAFRVRERTAYQKGFERERLWEGLADGALGAGDAIAFAEFLGRLLGQAHARAPRREGGRAQDALRAQLADPRSQAALAAETRAFAEHMARQTRVDQAILDELLQTRGHLMDCPR